MTERRQKEWMKKLFHALKPCAESLKAVFDISLFDKISETEVKLATLMFHRRHVYEHNGGEADQKYIDDSGDTSVRPKQTIRESDQSAKGICDVVVKLGENFHKGFHEIFPPEEKPISFHKRK